jgi:hypothetical protein
VFARTESCFGVGSKDFLGAPVRRAGLDRKIEAVAAERRRGAALNAQRQASPGTLPVQGPTEDCLTLPAATNLAHRARMKPKRLSAHVLIWVIQIAAVQSALNAVG